MFAFYRDVLCEACPIPSQIIPPTALDVATVGKLAVAPRGRDQKLAALAAWRVMRRPPPDRSGI